MSSGFLFLAYYSLSVAVRLGCLIEGPQIAIFSSRGSAPHPAGAPAPDPGWGAPAPQTPQKKPIYTFSGLPDRGPSQEHGGAPSAHPVSCLFYALFFNKLSHFSQK